MKQYSVTGMSCAACSARVEKAVACVEGVDSISVSLLTNSMAVDGTAPDDSVIEAVRKAGYDASPKESAEGRNNRMDAEEEALMDRETPRLKRRLIL